MLKSLKNNKFFVKSKVFLRFFKIDASFFIILILSVILNEFVLYLCFCVFTLMHELSHYFVAKKLGYLAKSIKLNFFGASLEGLDDFSLSDEIRVILAGPLFNLAVIVLCYLCFWFYPESYHYLGDVLTANWAIFVFNFLPVYPLDLGRILHALFSKKLKREDSLKLVKRISIFVIVILFAIYLASFFFELNFTFGFVVVNLCFLLFSSSKGTSFKRQLYVEHKYKLLSKGLIERNIYVKSEMPNYKLFKYIDDYHFFNFMFVDKNLEVVNSINEIELYKMLNLI